MILIKQRSKLETIIHCNKRLTRKKKDKKKADCGVG